MAFLVEIRKTHPCCLLAEMNYNFRDDTYTVSTTRSTRNTTPDVAKRPKTGIFERHLHGETSRITDVICGFSGSRKPYLDTRAGYFCLRKERFKVFLADVTKPYSSLAP